MLWPCHMRVRIYYAGYGLPSQLGGAQAQAYMQQAMYNAGTVYQPSLPYNLVCSVCSVFGWLKCNDLKAVVLIIQQLNILSFDSCMLVSSTAWPGRLPASAAAAISLCPPDCGCWLWRGSAAVAKRRWNSGEKTCRRTSDHDLSSLTCNLRCGMH